MTKRCPKCYINVIVKDDKLIEHYDDMGTLCTGTGSKVSPKRKYKYFGDEADNDNE